MEKELVSNRKLKFLFVSSDKFPPFRVDVAALFGQEMVRRGHSIDWLLQSKDPCNSPYRTRWSGCRVWVGVTDNGTSRFSRLRKHIYSIMHDFKMFSLVRHNKYDFVQVKDKLISGLMAILLSRLNGIKFVYWLSYPFPEANLYSSREGTARYPLFYFIRGLIFKVLLYRVIMPRADHIFVQSEQMKKDVFSMGLPDEKLTPVPMGVSLEMLPYEQKKGFPELSKDYKGVLYLGTLMKVRRMDFLIRVFEKVLNEVPNAKLYMVGGSEDPADEKFLMDEAAKLGIGHAIVFTGFLPRQEALHHVKKADVCVSPFYPTPILNSTSPTKLIEYMAMGKAVVANDHPEQRLIIEESGSGICVPYQEKAFADAIVELLRNPDRAKKMGKRGREYVFKHRSYAKIADIVESQYLRICKAG